MLDLTSMVNWVNSAAELLKNIYVLIFFSSFVLGLTVKSSAEQLKINASYIPLILAVFGLVTGAILLGSDPQSRFQGALVGLTLALASTGGHQIYVQTLKRKQE